MGAKAGATTADRHIEIVAADSAGLRESGFGSLATCRRVYDILKSHYARVQFNQVESERDLRLIVGRNPDLVVLCVKYVFDEDRKIWLSDYFSRRGVAHTGSGRAALEFDSNKAKAKKALRKVGLATAGFFLASPGSYASERLLPLPLPLFVKPLDAANSNGVDENSLVSDFASYVAKVEQLFSAYGNAVLVEEVLPGREFTVAVLDDSVGGIRLILPVEIVVPKNIFGDRILGCDEKSGNKEKLFLVEDPTLELISDLADKVFTLLGMSDFGRIDIKMDAYGVPHFMEVNLVPGMTPMTSYFPRACAINIHMTHRNTVLRIIESALSRAELHGRKPVAQQLPPIVDQNQVSIPTLPGIPGQ